MVQIVWSWRNGSRSIEHIGSAHDEVELAALKTASARLAAAQTVDVHEIPGHRVHAIPQVMGSVIDAGCGPRALSRTRSPASEIEQE